MGLPLRALGLAAGLAAVFAALVRRLHTLQVELEQAQAESSRQMKLRSEERAGRTKVERKLREQSRAPAAEASTAHSYSPIGYLTSCYVERRGTPRQGCLVPSARAQLKVSSQTVQAVAALDGLAQFSHVWLVYDFHQNTTTADKPQVRAKVHPGALIEVLTKTQASFPFADDAQYPAAARDDLARLRGLEEEALRTGLITALAKSGYGVARFVLADVLKA